MSTLGVFIQNYNYGCFLGEAIESVLKQTIQPTQLFVIDDCSNSFTDEMYIACIRHNIPIIKNEENLGCVKTLNKAVRLLDTEYVCALSADDRFGTPDYLEKLKQCLDNYPTVGIAYSNYVMFKDSTRFHVEHREFDGDELKKCNFIHGSAMYRKSCFEDVGGYPESKIAEDWYFWLNIVDKGWEAKKVHDIYLDYRQHEMGHRNHGRSQGK